MSILASIPKTLNNDICKIIASNFTIIEYDFDKWIVDSPYLCYFSLSTNPNAIDFLRNNEIFINYDELSKNINPNAMELLRKNFDKINWYNLSNNCGAIELLCENIDKINWNMLSYNYMAIEILEENQNKINWDNLSFNKGAIALLKKNKKKINWDNLSFNKNPEIIELLRKNPDKIDWVSLTTNENPEALKLFTPEILKSLNQYYFTSNRNAYEILKLYPEFIDKTKIGRMPFIFNIVKKPHPNYDDIYKTLQIVLC